MRNIIYCFTLCFFLLGCNNKKEVGEAGETAVDEKISNSDLIRNPISADVAADTTQIAKFEFETTEFDFGTIREGAQVTHEYKFKNAGKTPMLIKDVRSSCGCTVPEWPKAAIMPGDSSFIKVRFNSTKRAGSVDKSVNIVANTIPAITNLYLTGIVLKD